MYILSWRYSQSDREGFAMCSSLIARDVDAQLNAPGRARKSDFTEHLVDQRDQHISDFVMIKQD